MCARITAVSTAGKNFLGEKILASLVRLTTILFVFLFFPLFSFFSCFVSFFFLFFALLFFFFSFFRSYTRPLSLAWRSPLFLGGTLPRFACVGAYVSIVCLLNSITGTRHASFAETPLPRKLGCGY